MRSRYKYVQQLVVGRLSISLSPLFYQVDHMVGQVQVVNLCRGTYHFWGMFREPLPSGGEDPSGESPNGSIAFNQHVLLPKSCILSALAHLGCFPDQAPRVGNRAPPELTVAPLYLRIAGRLSQPCWLVCVVHDTQKEKGKVPSHCFGAITKLVKHIISPQSTRQARKRMNLQHISKVLCTVRADID